MDAEIRQEITHIKNKIDLLCNAIMGDPTRPDAPGIIIRLDRLEQKDKFKGKLLWVLGAGVGAAMGQAFLSLF